LKEERLKMKDERGKMKEERWVMVSTMALCSANSIAEIECDRIRSKKIVL